MIEWELRDRLMSEFDQFANNHRGHRLALVPLPDKQPGFLSRSLAKLLGLLDQEAWYNAFDYAHNANIKLAYGGDTAITCTLASLTTGSARESAAIDNSANLYLDAFVRLHFALQTGTPASDKVVNLYAAGSEDGTNYTDNATGADAAITLRSPTNLVLIGAINTPDAGALTYKSHPVAVSPAFGWTLPTKWSIVVENRTNLTANATEGNHAKAYNGVYATSI
jgi:hypothetical protein